MSRVRGGREEEEVYEDEEVDEDEDIADERDEQMSR